MRNSFSQFIFNQFKKNETHLHELTYLFWECTLRCNLHCRHCGSDCSADNTAPELPFEDFLQAIVPLHQTYTKNSITVVITGGEPLLRKDLPRCGSLLRKNGFLWGIVTNGCGYTPDMHRQLLAAGMGSITVSLDGLEASHNWLRANDQSFARAVNAIDLIAASCTGADSKRLHYDIVTCVHQKNIHELESLREFLITRQVRAWRLFTISPIGRAAHHEALCLTPQQLKQLMDFMVWARTDGRINLTFSCEAYLGTYERKVRDAYFFCRAGIQIASVLNDGSIAACPNNNRSFIQGNIYRDQFLDVWNNRFQVMRDRRWTKTGVCAQCNAYKNCNGGALHLWDEKKDSIMACIYRQLP